MIPTLDVLVQIGYAAAVSAAALLLTWRWRERGVSAPVALGLGVAAGYVVWRRLEEAWPENRVDRIFHLALLGGALGAAEALVRLPAPARWAARGAVALGVAWALLLPQDPAWKIGLVALGALVAWSALEWRAARVEGLGMPVAMVVVAGAGAQALGYGRSEFLAKMAGALAAAAAPLVVCALLRPRSSLARGGVTAFLLASLPLWICGWRLAKLPLESAAILAVAPLAAQRRSWIGAIVAAAAAAFAVFLSRAANPVDPLYGY